MDAEETPNRLSSTALPQEEAMGESAVCLFTYPDGEICGDSPVSPGSFEYFGEYLCEYHSEKAAEEMM